MKEILKLEDLEVKKHYKIIGTNPNFNAHGYWIIKILLIDNSKLNILGNNIMVLIEKTNVLMNNEHEITSVRLDSLFGPPLNRRCFKLTKNELFGELI